MIKKTIWKCDAVFLFLFKCHFAHTLLNYNNNWSSFCPKSIPCSHSNLEYSSTLFGYLSTKRDEIKNVHYYYIVLNSLICLSFSIVGNWLTDKTFIVLSEQSYWQEMVGDLWLWSILNLIEKLSFYLSLGVMVKLWPCLQIHFPCSLKSLDFGFMNLYLRCLVARHDMQIIFRNRPGWLCPTKSAFV